MFERISNGFTMARSSWRVLMGDKKLLIFPFISGVMTLLVMATFAVPMGLLHQEGKLLGADGRLHMWVYPVMFAYYVATYSVIIFCNAALVSCALLRFDGQPATLGDGLRLAMARLPQILAWAVVSATVGMILNIIENAGDKIGYWIKAILGTAWSVMTYFVVPILVVEKVGPIDAVKKSVALMRKTWGEALVGKVGLGLFFALLAIPLVVLMFVGFYLLNTSFALGVGVLVATGIMFLIYLAVAAAMNTIFLTAVYQFAAFQRCPEGFDETSMARAFGTK